MESACAVVEPSSLYTPPVLDGYTVYTKTGCSFCVKTKELLRKMDVDYIDCDGYLASDKAGFLAFIQTMTGGIAYRTFPMVFLDGTFVGGYTDLKAVMDKHSAFGWM